MNTDAVRTNAEERRPRDFHWWNMWTASSDAALYVAAVRMMGPMTLIPFLFQRTGINDSWLGLFQLSMLVTALSGPVGSALAGGRQWKLPFCVRVGVLQRVPFLAVPLGVMFFFDRPYVLLGLLVLAWLGSYLFAGVAMPVYSVVLTNSVRGDWWGRLVSLRQGMASLAGVGATALVWAINHAYEPPGSYMRLGWVGVAMVFASLFFVWILKEAPIRQERAHGSEGARASWQRMVGILREDSRVRWVIAGRIFRSAGFLVGVYITAVFIERCGLDEEQMWMPVIMTTVPGAAAFLFSGWFVDHFGVRLASVFSGLLLCATSVALFWTYNVTAFIVLFAFLALATTLMASSWMPMLMKLAPEETRPAYVSTINLAAAPFTALFLVAGIIMVQYTGFEYIFAVPAVGGILSAAVFYFKLPHIH